ncbi:MAG: beta-glucosidase [Actinomycetota bacterium]|nr:beta-glucosidase [Actinomycetota bacterium]
MMSGHLPDGKVLAYGTATASYQVEGSTNADGRGPSIWDTFAAKPGTIVDGSDGSVACGSYERLDDDLALLGELGVAFYRFSIAWPRIQPDGQGRIEPRGFDYYDRLVDGLLDRGVAPMATLYHWDLPQPLEDAGGWPARDTALRFADYATTVHERLGDRVQLWATLNEPWCSAFLGYAAGKHAPGREDGDAAYRAAHHLLLGHGLAAKRLHESGAEGVGIVLNLTPVWPETDEANGAARVVDAIHNRVWLDPLVHGRYADDLLDLAAPLRDDDVVRDGDLATVAGSLDWLGVNYYTPARVAVADPDAGDEGGLGQMTQAYPGLADAAFRPRAPRTEMGWEIEPAGLEDLLVQTAGRVPGVPLLVTENGAAFGDDERDADGAIVDPDRIDYLDTHIAAVERARQGGADVRAYIAWTLLDNFEWAEGYTKKFGLVEVDPETLRRIPKASYRWYADHIRATP